MFTQGYQPTWEINFKSVPQVDKKTITSNKKLSKHLMLPKVPFYFKNIPNLEQQTKEVENMRMIFGYFNVQLVKETDHSLRQRAIRLTKAITEFANDNIEVGDKKMNLYRTLNQKICDIFVKLTHEEEKVLRGEYEIVDLI